MYAECRDPFEQWLGEAEKKLGQWRRMEKGMGEQIEKLKVHARMHAHTSTCTCTAQYILCSRVVLCTINQEIFMLIKVLIKIVRSFCDIQF